MQLSCPCFVAFDADGNLVVSDLGNHHIQVLRCSDGSLLRTIGSKGAGDGQFDNPHGIVFDRLGHLVVADWSNHRVLGTLMGLTFEPLAARDTAQGSLCIPVMWPLTPMETLLFMTDG